MTALLDAPQNLDIIPPTPETKYSLVRLPGTTLLPDPGERRFSTHYMQRALELDSTFDAVRAEDQSEWQQFDVFDQQGWLLWTGMVR